MKIKILFLFLITITLSGCTIVYNNDDNFNNDENFEDEAPSPEIPEDESPSNPIEENILFYPTSLSIESQIIQDYNYIHEPLKNDYIIHSAYYSQEYDTIYISYDKKENPIQTLTAKDLYDIEQHAIMYFESDENRSEDKEYLKAVRIYPDALASSCRVKISDENAEQINGCADYGGEKAIIDLNKIHSMSNFYDEQRIDIDETKYKLIEPMRDTFAHEYGHISTFYHLAYKNDENYEDYLKLRLAGLFDTVYKNGYPQYYTSDDDYTIQPEEILADDFVELFYNTSEKNINDKSEYTLSYLDQRNSLKDYEEITFLKNNETLYETTKNYYKNNFLDYTNKTTYSKPKIISSSNNEIKYYESYSKIGNVENELTISSLIDVNLIAVGEITYNNEKYYRVILSNTTKLISGTYNQKNTGKKLGYVHSDSYTENNSLNIYKVKEVNQNSLQPIMSSPELHLYLLGYYDFSYVIELSSRYDIYYHQNIITMYDYLSQEITNQTYEIPETSLTIIN